MIRFCRISRSTVRATCTAPTLRSDSSVSTTSRWRQASGTISSVCATRSGQAHRLDHVRIARGAHEFAQRGLHDGRLPLHHRDVAARLLDRSRQFPACEA